MPELDDAPPRPDQKLCITQQEFETACSSLLEKIFTATDRALNDYVEAIQERDRVSVDRLTSLDEVILVGGATRMPMIRRRLERLFVGKRLNESIDADRAVAAGAAVKAAAIPTSQVRFNREKELKAIFRIRSMYRNYNA